MTSQQSSIDPSDILKVAVYPPLGIARVGNAEGLNDYFLAPEIVGASPEAAVAMRDTTGRIKRQAVRFRVYAHLKSGDVRELTLDDGAQIRWRVAVANLKAGWYEFNNALDLPDGVAIPSGRRNPGTPNGRFRLDITPLPCSIAGRGQSGKAYHLEGKFFAQAIYLGELRTDQAGRLLFLGGHGRAVPRWPEAKPNTFANNTLWCDDVCDGPVRASVTIGGETFEATPGYVAVAPPNYAPGLFGIVTMDDVVRDLFIAQGWIPDVAQVSFTRDIWPLFSRLTAMQWVNHGLFMTHGFGSPLDAEDPKVLARLTDRSAQGGAWKQGVLKLFRDPGMAGPLNPFQLPYVYGDTYNDVPDDARRLLAVTATMYRCLERWARGDFLDDWDAAAVAPRFDTLAPADQIEQLCRAPLYECLGGPFHPGIELTWIMRRASMWASSYRLNVLDEEAPARQDYGPLLDAVTCLGAGGPVDGVAAGSLTRWLGVPWHTDEASCLSDFEYSPSTYLSMPSYWGARVPNQILSAEAWSRATDSESPNLQRMKHASYREDWTRDINGRDYYERIDTMTREWWKLGMLTPHETPDELRDLGMPATSHVENGRDAKSAGSNDKVALIAQVERIDTPVAPHAGMAAQAPTIKSQPPRRTFGRGEV